jgi:hypothetical protein
MAPDHLFSKVDWSAVQNYQKRQLSDEVDAIDGTRLLNTSVEDLCNYLEKKYRVDVPILRESEIVADQQEVQIDGRRDRLHRIHQVAGTAIEVIIPFDGDSEAFKIQPTTYTFDPPFGDIRGDKLVLRIEGTDLKAERVRAEIDHTLSEIKNYLENLRRDAEGLNNQLRQFADNHINRRRNKLLADSNLVAALGFPLKERKDQPRTYVAPQVRRKITPILPSATTASFKPEPTLSEADYDHILGVIDNMAQVMELSPSAFASMDEESLRSHFLVQLNGQYEGQATGETFNYEGRTDILVRVEGRNIFIGECKFWGGPKRLIETIDQLLSYSSWRDTKVAVILFNRRKNFSGVLDAIPTTVEAHPNFKRTLGCQSESNFRYVFAHRDDPNREMLLTVLAFDVPK